LANGDQVTVTITDGIGCTASDGPITTTVNPLPTVTLTSSDADNTICLGDAVTFTATSATATNYEFFLNAVSDQNGASNTYSPALADGDQVTVTVTDGNGCTASDGPITTTVNPLPTVTLTSSDADNIICIGDLVTFTATSVTATNYEFFLNGSSDQNGASNTYATVLADGDQVTVTVTDGNGCIASDGPITTTVNNPTVTLTSSDADNIICLGDPVTFTATSATAVNYEFFLNGGSDQNGVSNTYSPVLADGDQVTVTITDGNGCIASDGTITTTVNPLPVVTLTSSDADNIICIGDPVTFTATSATAINYEFFLNGGSAQNGASSTYSPVLADGDQVTVTVIDVNGCIASDGPITTMVNNPTVTLTSSDADDIICLGDPVTFTATSVTAVNYEFFLNGGSTQNGASNTYASVLADGDFVEVTITDAIGCMASDGPITTMVNPLPTVTLTTSDTDNIICAGDSVTFTATSTTALNYEFFLNGSSAQNGASITYSPVLANGDMVTVTITDGNGCTAGNGPITTTVNTSPTVSLTSSDADNIICIGDPPVTFTATSATAVNYEFFLNGSSDQSGGSNTYSTVLTDGDQVTVSVTDGNACTASDGITTTVNNPTVSLTSSDADNTICAGDLVTFTANSAAGINFEFFLNGGSDQNGPSNTYSPVLADGDFVDVTITDAIGCMASDGPITTTLIGFSADILIGTSSFSNLNTGTIPVMDINGGTPPYQIQAKLINPLIPGQVLETALEDVLFDSISGQYNFTFEDLFAGDYEITVSDINGCMEIFTGNVGLDLDLMIPNIFTPNDDGFNDTFFVINLPEAGASLIITNRWGKILFRSNSYQNDWNAAGLGDGLYFFEIVIGGIGYTGWIEVIRG